MLVFRGVEKWYLTPSEKLNMLHQKLVKKDIGKKEIPNLESHLSLKVHMLLFSGTLEVDFFPISGGGEIPWEIATVQVTNPKVHLKQIPKTSVIFRKSHRERKQQ